MGGRGGGGEGAVEAVGKGVVVACGWGEVGQGNGGGEIGFFAEGGNLGGLCPVWRGLSAIGDGHREIYGVRLSKQDLCNSGIHVPYTGEL